MKFTAQTTTTRPIDMAMTTRLGARPAEVSTYTESGQPLLAHGEFLDPVQPRHKADPRLARHANGSLRRNRHFRLDDIFVPIPPARRHVARQSKIRQARKPNVVRSADAGLQHSTAPYRNRVRLTQIMNLLRHG